MKSVLSFRRKLLKSKEPQFESYLTLAVTISNEFCGFVAHLLQLFLTKYQIDWKMISFYFDDLMTLAIKLTCFFIESEAGFKNKWKFESLISVRRKSQKFVLNLLWKAH